MAWLDVEHRHHPPCLYFDIAGSAFGGFIHGALNSMISSMTGTSRAAAAPDGDVSNVTCRSGCTSFSARKAGVVISTSPALSSRTQSSLRLRCHAECIAVTFGIPRRWLTVTELRAGKAGLCRHVDASLAFPTRDPHTDPGEGFPLDVYLRHVRAQYAEIRAARADSAAL